MPIQVRVQTVATCSRCGANVVIAGQVEPPRVVAILFQHGWRPTPLGDDILCPGHKPGGQ